MFFISAFGDGACLAFARESAVRWSSAEVCIELRSSRTGLEDVALEVHVEDDPVTLLDACWEVQMFALPRLHIGCDAGEERDTLLAEVFGMCSALNL